MKVICQNCRKHFKEACPQCGRREGLNKVMTPDGEQYQCSCGNLFKEGDGGIVDSTHCAECVKEFRRQFGLPSLEEVLNLKKEKIPGGEFF